MEYRPATEPELEARWERNIRDNPGDQRWVGWKQEYIGYHLSGKSVTFLAMEGEVPVGEGTLLLSPECRAVAGQLSLCDGKTTGNVNALRMDKAYEGQGHMSRLVTLMEQYAKSRGLSRLTIGVDAKETRNLAIYLHWGFTLFLFSEWDEGELVLYFAKELN